jgi:hypothetical protein
MNEEQIIDQIVKKHTLPTLLSEEQTIGKTVLKIYKDYDENIVLFFTDNTAFWVHTQPSWENTIRSDIMLKIDSDFLFILSEGLGRKEPYDEYKKIDAQLTEERNQKGRREQYERLKAEFG